ncbi:MAG: DUF418 domain-containing protein [bacterium]|nr:DUF418 domain-containing protein [bacterium]
MTPSAPAPVSTGDRIVAIDVVRGLAVLGILAMNIVEFGLPQHAYGNPAVAGGATGADLTTWLWQSTLFDGRMRALFSMLFGAGIVLINERLAARGLSGSAADVLLRRCLWLIPFGLVHRFFLQWTGDILYIYGLFGVLAVGFRNLRPRTLLVLGIASLFAFLPIELRRYSGVAELRDDAVAAQQFAAAEEEVPEDLAAALSRWQRRTKPPVPEDNTAEIAAMRGSWVDIVRLRWDHNHRFQHAFVYHYFLWDVGGMLLIGMGLAGFGFFAGRLRARTYAMFFVVGVAAAVGSYWFAREHAAVSWSRADIDMHWWRQVLYPWLRGLTGLGWAALLILLLRTPLAGALGTLLGNVGRMAFTNYILQTLLCTSFFFGWGLGYFGELSRSELMIVVLVVSVVQIVFSVVWLRVFRFGPLEWLWRSLCYWQRQPMRR